MIIHAHFLFFDSEGVVEEVVVEGCLWLFRRLFRACDSSSSFSRSNLKDFIIWERKRKKEKIEVERERKQIEH